MITLASHNIAKTFINKLIQTISIMINHFGCRRLQTTLSYDNNTCFWTLNKSKHNSIYLTITWAMTKKWIKLYLILPIALIWHNLSAFTVFGLLVKWIRLRESSFIVQQCDTVSAAARLHLQLYHIIWTTYISRKYIDNHALWCHRSCSNHWIC